ncbi:MAG: hypothetical protein J6J00_12215 [Treponema sp.]|nr:hypothetical protein [Treponema sp.]
MISQYHNILCPQKDYPAFIDKYIALPIMQRLSGIGLLCGSDWTKLFCNRFYYSRLDHSKGVSLIIWHFTHDKAQTLAGLFHDVSTPVFSHVSDFRKGDALTQTATEAPTAQMIRKNAELMNLLAEDGLTAEQVEDYHIYPIADNEIPQLSADRLEYMFPSGMALNDCWSMEEIQTVYRDLEVLRAEDGVEELGFKTVETAELYCEKFCMIGHILQLNEDKLTLQMLGEIMNLAERLGVLSEDDFMTLSENQVIAKLEEFCKAQGGVTSRDEKIKLCRLYKTFRQMTKIEHTELALPEDQYFCVNLKVKQRFINPLVISTGSITAGDTLCTAGGTGTPADCTTKGVRLSQVSQKSAKIIEDFKKFSDTPYGCVKLI